MSKHESTIREFDLALINAGLKINTWPVCSEGTSAASLSHILRFLTTVKAYTPQSLVCTAERGGEIFNMNPRTFIRNMKALEALGLIKVHHDHAPNIVYCLDRDAVIDLAEAQTRTKITAFRGLPEELPTL